MKIFFLVVIAFTAIVTSSSAQDSLYFKGYNIVGENNFICSGRLIQTADSLYEIVCIDQAIADVPAGVRITKLNLDGTVVWSQKITSSKKLWYPSACAAPDSGSLICCASLYDAADHLYSIDLIKLNAEGIIQWTVSLNDSFASYNLQVYAIGNSFYLSCISSALSNCSLLKFSFDGILQWSRQFLPSTFDAYYGAGTVTSDGNIILTGSFDGFEVWFYVFTIDTNGSVLSCKKFQGGYYNPHTCIVDLSGDVVLVGTVGTEYGTFTKVSKQGDVIFNKKVEFGPNYDEIWDVLQSSDSSYYLIAEPESYIGHSQMGILKFDKAGNFLWMKVYSYGSRSFPFNGVMNADSTITVAGTLGSYEEPGDLYLIRVDADGNASCDSHPEVPEITDIVLVPDSGYTVDSINAVGSLAFAQQSYSTQSYQVCDSIALTVNFILNEDHPDLPSLFSPGGTMPYWQIMNDPGIHFIQLLLSDIYGRIIFQTTDPLFKWNGTANGVMLSSGMYCWSAGIIFDGSTREKLFSGKVILMR